MRSIANKPRLFIDTSVLFSGIWSQAGGARLILNLGEAGAIHLLVSSQVLAEIDAVMRQKAPEQLPRLALLIDRSQAAIVPPAPVEYMEHCRGLTGHAGDARILADAWAANVDFFTTLDKQHFLENPALQNILPFPIGTPGDFIGWYREIFIS